MPPPPPAVVHDERGLGEGQGEGHGEESTSGGSRPPSPSQKEPFDDYQAFVASLPRGNSRPGSPESFGSERSAASMAESDEVRALAQEAVAIRGGIQNPNGRAKRVTPALASVRRALPATILPAHALNP